MKTWNTIDKSEWQNDGEWINEPDKAQWIDEKTGLDCLVVRGGSGALCGYVGLPESHKLFGTDYWDIKEDIDVHGGLTFADVCGPSEDPSRGICHTGGVANKKVWWLGFDCAHSGDICPKLERNYCGYDMYRRFGYVKNEVEYLASQLKSIGR